jgi:hypothetical protein
MSEPKWTWREDMELRALFAENDTVEVASQTVCEELFDTAEAFNSSATIFDPAVINTARAKCRQIGVKPVPTQLAAEALRRLYGDVLAAREPHWKQEMRDEVDTLTLKLVEAKAMVIKMADRLERAAAEISRWKALARRRKQ